MQPNKLLLQRLFPFFSLELWWSLCKPKHAKFCPWCKISEHNHGSVTLQQHPSLSYPTLMWSSIELMRNELPLAPCEFLEIADLELGNLWFLFGSCLSCLVSFLLTWSLAIFASSSGAAFRALWVSWNCWLGAWQSLLPLQEWFPSPPPSTGIWVSPWSRSVLLHGMKVMSYTPFSQQRFALQAAEQPTNKNTTRTARFSFSY